MLFYNSDGNPTLKLTAIVKQEKRTSSALARVRLEVQPWSSWNDF